MGIERSDAVVSIKLIPALQRAQANPGFSGESGEGYLVFDVKSKNPPPLSAAELVRAVRAERERELLGE